MHQFNSAAQPLWNIIRHLLLFTMMTQPVHHIESHRFNKLVKFIFTEVKRGNNRFNPGHELVFHAINLRRHKAERYQRQIVLFKEAPADADIQNAGCTEFVKALVIGPHRQEDKIPSLKQDALTVDLLVVAAGQNNRVLVVVMLVQTTGALRLVVDNHVKIFAIKQLLFKCGFNFHRADLLLQHPT